MTASYRLDPVSLGLTLRGLSEGKYNSNWITCTTACPVSTANYITSNFNTLPSAWYLDLNSSYAVTPERQCVLQCQKPVQCESPRLLSGPQQ